MPPLLIATWACLRLYETFALALSGLMKTVSRSLWYVSSVFEVSTAVVANVSMSASANRWRGRAPAMMTIAVRDHAEHERGAEIGLAHDQRRPACPRERARRAAAAPWVVALRWRGRR